MRFTKGFNDKEQHKILDQAMDYIIYDLKLDEPIHNFITRLWKQPDESNMWLVWDSYEELKSVIDQILKVYKV